MLTGVLAAERDALKSKVYVLEKKLNDLLDMLRDELADSIQRTKDLRERISDIEEELMEGRC